MYRDFHLRVWATCAESGVVSIVASKSVVDRLLYCSFMIWKGCVKIFLNQYYAPMGTLEHSFSQPHSLPSRLKRPGVRYPRSRFELVLLA